MAEEEAAGVRVTRGGPVDVGIKNRILRFWSACQDAAVGRADERLSGESQAIFGADAVAKRDEISVLKRSHAHLAFIQAFRPFVDAARLCLLNETGATET